MQAIKNFLKFIFAGIVAVAILCVILIPYSLTPVHIENSKGNTDYIWPSNAPWCKMTEGVAWGRFDENGYNNIEVVENPDILVLGSSHTEAVNVLQSQNFAALLGEMFEDVYTIYNMGISGHFFLKVCKYLPKTIELNPEAKYIIIETSDVAFEQWDVDRLLNGTVEYTPSNSKGLIGLLQKLPFFRLTYHQITGGLLDLLIPQKTQGSNTSAMLIEKPLPNESVYDALFTYIQDILQDVNTKLIIMYHPTGTLLEDGSVTFGDNDASLAMFRDKCNAYGFSFVDMTQPFTEMYEKEHKLPHGFITGTIGSGHLNADGHAKIAAEVAECIWMLEEVE